MKETNWVNNKDTILKGVFLIGMSNKYFDDGEFEEIISDIEKSAGDKLSKVCVDRIKKMKGSEVKEGLLDNELFCQQKTNMNRVLKSHVSNNVLDSNKKLAIDAFSIAHFGYNHKKNKNAFYSLHSKVFFVKNIIKDVKPAGYLDNDRRIPYVRVAGHDNLIYAYTLGTVLDIRNIKESKDYSGKQFNSYDFTEYELLHE